MKTKLTKQLNEFMVEPTVHVGALGDTYALTGPCLLNTFIDRMGLSKQVMDLAKKDILLRIKYHKRLDTTRNFNRILPNGSKMSLSPNKGEVVVDRKFMERMMFDPIPGILRLANRYDEFMEDADTPGTLEDALESTI